MAGGKPSAASRVSLDDFFCGALRIGVLVLALPALAEEASVTNALAPAEGSFRVRAGADLRIRQEIMDNIPGLPGDESGYAMTSSERAKFKNQIRFRPRVWFEAATGPLRLFARVTDEFREYPTLNTPNGQRAYDFPDEVILDNLYLDASGLEADWLRSARIDRLDLRVGRQDLFERGSSIFGLNRLFIDGTAGDGSRSFYADMVRARLHFDESRHLDVFGLYDTGYNGLSFGNEQSRGRALNCYNPTDWNDLDEWGAGLVYSQNAFDGQLPFKVYSVFKRNTGYTTEKPTHRHVSAKELTTLGILLEPRLTDNWGLELEAAKQVGRIVEGNREAGGHMAFVGVNYYADLLRAYRPTLTLSTVYYSGDKHRADPDGNDTGWDPLWARCPQECEMFLYGTLYGNAYWSNLIYSKLKFKMTFGPQHAICAYSGPMFAAVQDDLGRSDHNGSTFKGVLSVARYDFPIRLAPKDATGLDRFEISGHLLFELFNPGSYYDSEKPAYFVRWQVDFRF